MVAKPERLRVAVTGAAGFIGRAVIDRIDRGALGAAADLCLNDVEPLGHADSICVQGSYADPRVRALLLAGGVDILFHLASLPGGASERDPDLGRLVNLDGTIALIDEAATTGCPVVVYTSSIAALNIADGPVGATTALRPRGSYGTHKAMVELYLADLTRRGAIDARAIRPAGVVARPRESFAGFATAWMSDLFYAALDQRAIAVPARADTQIWLQSIDTVADNIIHAALMPVVGLPPHRSWTLPATVVRVDALVAALERRTGHLVEISYSDGPIDQPPLDARDATDIGFMSDGDADALIDKVIWGSRDAKKASLAAASDIP